MTRLTLNRMQKNWLSDGKNQQQEEHDRFGRQNLKFKSLLKVFEPLPRMIFRFIYITFSGKPQPQLHFLSLQQHRDKNRQFVQLCLSFIFCLYNNTEIKTDNFCNYAADLFFVFTTTPRQKRTICAIMPQLFCINNNHRDKNRQFVQLIKTEETPWCCGYGKRLTYYISYK